MRTGKICISQYFSARLARAAQASCRRARDSASTIAAASAWLLEPLQEQRHVEHGIRIGGIGVERARSRQSIASLVRP